MKMTLPLNKTVLKNTLLDEKARYLKKAYDRVFSDKSIQAE
jgi:hypothetical protein